MDKTSTPLQPLNIQMQQNQSNKDGSSFYPLQVNIPISHSNWEHQDFEDPLYTVWRQAMIEYLKTLPDLSKRPPELKNLLIQLASSILEQKQS